MQLMRKVVFFCALFVPCIAVAANDVTRLDMGSGPEALLIEDHSLPMVTLQLTFPYAGSVSDVAEKAGRANLSARLLGEGSGADDAQAFHRKLEEKAIRLGAGAGQDNLNISLKTLSEHLPAAIALLTQMITQPRFDKVAFVQMQRQLQTDLKQSAQDPNWQAWRAWSEHAYAGSPYGQPTQGTEKTVAGLSVADAKAWHASVLGRNRVLIAAVGDVSATTLQELLKPLLAALPEKAAFTPPAKTKPIPVAQEPVLVKMEVPQTVALFGFPSVSRTDPDFYAAYLMNHILGGGSLVSRLSNAIREEKGLAYSVGSNLNAGLLDATLQGMFATRNEQVAEAVKTLEKVLTRYAREGAKAVELQNAKNYITGSFPLELDSQQARAGFLSSMLLYHLGDDYLEKRNAYFQAVTLKDVKRMAKKMLSQAPLLVLAGSPPQKIEWTEHDIALPTKN